MLLTYIPERSPSSTSRFTKKVFRIAIRTLQIVLIIALFYRYGTGRKEANVWWSEVAEINENVPLLVKSMYPTFPKDSRICLQNVTLVFNQRFNNAFLFRYPNSELGGVYVKEFGKCVRKDKLSTDPFYFFYYDNGVVHDLTCETKEKITGQHTIYEQKLFREPHHKLSKGKPQLHLELHEIFPCSAIGIVTSLANGIEVVQGTVIARGQIEGNTGVVEMFEIVAGQDTAEWAIRFPNIQKIVKHKTPQAYRAWTVRQPDETITVAQNYMKRVNFQMPFVPTKFFLEFVSSSDIPSNLVLDVDRIVFYVDKKTEK